MVIAKWQRTWQKQTNNNNNKCSHGGERNLSGGNEDFVCLYVYAAHRIHTGETQPWLVEKGSWTVGIVWEPGDKMTDDPLETDEVPKELSAVRRKSI